MAFQTGSNFIDLKGEKDTSHGKWKREKNKEQYKSRKFKKGSRKEEKKTAGSKR